MKPDAEREPGYMERDLARMRDQLERDQKRYSEAADRRLFRSWVKRALALPPDQRIGAVDAAFAGAADDAALDAKIAQVFGASRVFDLAARKAMFDETPDALKGRKDPLVDLGMALDAERKALKDRRDAAAGATLRLRPAWRQAVIAEAGHPVAPDANSSLRVTFGRVRGYSPREAVTMAPHTTLAGAVEKHTGEDPFDLPAPVREAFAAKRFGRWADPALGQVPIGILSDCDTTGRQLGQPDDRRGGAPRRRQLRPRVGERGQRLRLQPRRGAQRQRRRALPALEPRRDRGRFGPAEGAGRRVGGSSG